MADSRRSPPKGGRDRKPSLLNVSKRPVADIFSLQGEV
jgi:hypothetical protein